MKVGDKVTIWRYQHSGSSIVGITEIVSITSRQIKTADGRVWTRKGDEYGHKSPLNLDVYREGDDRKFERSGKLARAIGFLRLGHTWQIERDLDLLDDADLDTLAELAAKLKAKMVEREQKKQNL